MNIWLDTDIGSDVDDAVALLCMLRHPEARLVGISTVMHRVEINAWLCEEMLRRARRAGIPVLSGSAVPLGGDPAAEDASDWAPSHAALVPPLPRLSARDDARRVAAIAEAMAVVTEPYHLLTIGPLTNIGRLLSDHPEVAYRWLSVTCMGGRLEDGAEYNVQCDAVAARVVVDRTAPTMVGLEASTYTLTREETESALDPAVPASAFLLDCYREYRGNADWLEGKNKAPLTLYDAITFIAMVRPELFTFQQVNVLVEQDGRLRLTDDGSPVRYATQCDWERTKATILCLMRMPG